MPPPQGTESPEEAIEIGITEVEAAASEATRGGEVAAVQAPAGLFAAPALSAKDQPEELALPLGGKGSQEKRSTPDELQRRLKEQIALLSLDRVTKGISSQPVLDGRQPVSLGLAELIGLTLQHSKSVQAQRIRPAEELQQVNREFGQFDWRAFLDNQFQQDNQPVGDSLQLDSGVVLDAVRNDNHSWTYGVRKDTQTGGRFELSETLGLRDSDSGLLTPPDQGTAQFRVVFSQELLRDGGRDFVLSRALTASYDAEQVHAESFAVISNLLQQTLGAYWRLYEARGAYFVQLSLIRWAEETLKVLESRKDLDAEQNSIEQARALLLDARADLADARAAVLIAQDELYRSVNAPGIDSERVEVLTAEIPQAAADPLLLEQELAAALSNRAEIAQSLSEIKEAALEYQVSLNQLLPRLTLSLEGSLNGLDGRSDVTGAKRNYGDTNPSYQVGINFEVPLGNRSAKAQNKQAQLALRRLQFEYEDQIEEVRLDVSRSIRTLNASTSVLSLRRSTLEARQKEIKYLRVRRDVAPQAGASTSLLLEQSFQAISRLIDSQQQYVTAVTSQQTALADLLRAKGLLLSRSEPPCDIPTVVPSIRGALREREINRRAFVHEARSRVVTPGVTEPIPVRK